MNVNRWVKYTGMCAIGCFISSITCLKFFTSFTTVSQYHLDLDPRFSSATRILIEQTLTSAQGVPLDRCHQLLEQLRSTLPSIAASALTLHQSHTAAITIKAHEPVLVVNDVFCVAIGGDAFARQQLLDSASQHLPALLVHDYNPQDRLLNRMMCDWSKQIDPAIFAAHRIEWRDQTSIYLRPIGNSSYIIHCNHQTPPTTQLLATCVAAQKQQAALAGRHAWHWIADIRFANQIIFKKKDILCTSDAKVRV